MREIRTYGSEGGGVDKRLSLPLSGDSDFFAGRRGRDTGILRFTSVYEGLLSRRESPAIQPESGSGQVPDGEATAPERGGWLSPVELASTHGQESRRKLAGQASNRRCLPMSELDYLHLAGRSGRVILHGEGRISASAPPILA